MLAQSIRQAVAAAPRVGLAAVSALLWKAFAAGQVTEDEAAEISGLIEARKAVPAAAPAPRRSVGSRPRAPEDVERRRRMVAAGWLPPAVAARFTPGETAALAVVAREVQARGRCALPVRMVARMAGVGRTTVRNAIRAARALGFLHVEERRVSACRNEANRVTVVDPGWASWLRVGRKGGGVRSVAPNSTGDIYGAGRPVGTRKGLPGGRVGEGAEPARAGPGDAGGVARGAPRGRGGLARTGSGVHRWG